MKFNIYTITVDEAFVAYFYLAQSTAFCYWVDGISLRAAATAAVTACSAAAAAAATSAAAAAAAEAQAVAATVAVAHSDILSTQ